MPAKTTVPRNDMKAVHNYEIHQKLKGQKMNYAKYINIKNKYSIYCILLFSVYAISGCASISTEIVCMKANNNDNPPTKNKNIKGCSDEINVADGITYYMPKRDIRVNVVIANNTETSTESNSNVEKKKTKTTNNDSQILASKSVTAKKKVTISIVDNYAVETLPDLNNVFLLRYNKNYIGANNMAVGVNSSGLLSITHADTINKINEIAANVAVDVAAIAMGGGFIPASNSANSSSRAALPTLGNFAGPSFNSPKENTVILNNVNVDTNQCEEGTYSFLIDPLTLDPINVDPLTNRDEKLKKAENADSSSIPNATKKTDTSSNLDTANKPKPNNPIEFCGVAIFVKSYPEIKQKNSYWIDPNGIFDQLRIKTRRARNALAYLPSQQQYTVDSLPGIFYKQDIPYNIEICRVNDKEDHKCKMPANQLIAFSPNASKIYFAPITETYFSDNTSDITLLNGVVNSLKENTDSELLALSKIPASVLGAYTNAVGEIFKSFSAVSENQGTALSKELTLYSKQVKVNRCQVAIATNNPDGKKGDELTTALNNIQTACAE